MNKFVFLLCSFIFLSVTRVFSVPEHVSEKNLLGITMESDIATSSYYELQIWADRLGLSTSGTKEELQHKLYAYYKIKPAQQNTAEHTDTIVIKSARKLEKIKIEKIDENYIVLSGGVHLEMSDKKNNTFHEIYADKIIFNQTQKTLTATGSITYIIIHDNAKEYFYGDSLTFNIQSWEGMFFKGVSEKTKKVNDNDVTFYFSGREIYRKEGDKVILVDGRISSSRDKNPFYHLNAKKIWVLNPGEWAIQDPVLFVGRIPVFAFPFLFMPGDRMIFHPIYGVNDKNGYFINTTTYLIGQKKETGNNSLSFLQSSSQEGETLLKNEGLFLRKTAIPAPPQKTMLKILADYYTRKGFFLGFDGSVKDKGMIQSFTIFTGIGINRYIYTDSLYGYTPYAYDSTTGEYLSSWEHPYFLGTKFPFRFAFDTELTGKIQNATIILALPLYSDPSFSQDFLNRKENFDFKSFFKSSEGTDVLSESSTENLLKENLLFDVSFQWNINTAALKPFIQKLSINKLTVNTTLLSKEYQYATQPVDPLYFYYPQNITYPDFSGILSGTLFTFHSTETAKAPVPLDGRMKPPWNEEGKSTSPPENANSILPPVSTEDVPLPKDYLYNGINGSLVYSIFPRMTVRSILNSQAPSLPEDTLTRPDYSLFSFQDTASLLYSFTVSDKLVSINSKLTLNSNYKNHFSRSDTYDGDWSVLLDQDKQNTNYSFLNGTTIKSYPLLWTKNFSNSYISYTINSLLFSHSYNNYTYLAWNTDNITSHQATVSTEYDITGNTYTAEVTMILPPYSPELYPSLKTSWGKLSTIVSTGFKKDPDSLIWIVDPLSILGKYTFDEVGYVSETLTFDYYQPDSVSTTNISLHSPDFPLTVNQIFTYNISDNKPVVSTSSLGVGIFTSSFTAENLNGYTFNPNSGWIVNNEKKFQPSKLSLGLKYEFKPDPIWKNRISFHSGIESSWSMNLLKPTDTSFIFNLSFSLSIAEFLDLNFKSESVNRAFYRYIPQFSNELGLPETVNPFVDLVKSFNFFKKSDRLASSFNLNLLDFTVVHHLKNWDLNVEYTGKPEIVTTEDLHQEYQWNSSFSIFLSWKPIPEIKKNVTITNDEITF